MPTLDQAKTLVEQALEEYLESQEGKKYVPLKDGSALRNHFEIGSIYRQDVADSDSMVMFYHSIPLLNTQPKQAVISVAYAWKGRYLDKDSAEYAHYMGGVQVSSAIVTVGWDKDGFVDTKSTFLNVSKWILWESKPEPFINWINESPFRGDKP